MAKTQKKAKESKNGYTLGDQFIWGSYNEVKGRPNPSRVTFAQLRNLSYANNLVRNCINRIKHTVTKVDWFVKPKDEEADPLQYQEQIDYVTKLIENPNDQSNGRDLFSMLAEDILVLDNAVIEKVRNGKGQIVNLYNVDGSTIRPNIDEFGLLADPAYFQYISESTVTGMPDVEFSKDDLIVCQINPQVQNGRQGYGMSPVEAIIQTVVTTLQTAIYNQSIFNSNQLPPFMATLPKATPEDLKNFKAQFMKSVENNAWTVAFVNNEGFDVKQLRPSNQDMQFLELSDWLAKIVFAAFELSPQDFGMTGDVNRATSQTQEKLEQGPHNVVDEIADKINRCVIQDLGLFDKKFMDLEFSFDTLNKSDELQKAQVDQIYINSGVVVPNEIRNELGLDPIAGGDVARTQQPTGLMGNDLYNFGQTIKSFNKSKWQNWY